ncbi:MAG: hypothetical protein H7839_18780 [Magnetococcus sp. YQC-5]
MLTINRSVLIVKPRLPFLEWVNKACASDPPMILDDLTTEQSVYLIPEVDEGELELHVRRHYKTIFEHEMVSWVRNQTLWPNRLTFQMFEQWFQLEWGSEVFDLGKGAITQERLNV